MGFQRRFLDRRLFFLLVRFMNDPEKTVAEYFLKLRSTDLSCNAVTLPFDEQVFALDCRVFQGEGLFVSD